MKRIGKQTKINIAANRILARKYLELEITRCEVKLSECMPNFGLGFAHRHKRVWYYGRPELLSKIEETVLACASCHPKMESDKQLTGEIFERLRSPEKLKQLLK